MKNKMKFVIALIVSSIIVLSGLTFGIRAIMIAKKIPPKDPKGVFIVGLPDGQRSGVVKELEDAAKEDSYIKKADELMKDGKIEEAIKSYEAALALAKFSGSKAVIYFHMADAYEKRRDYRNALGRIIIIRDKFVNDWAKEPVVERTKYLEYALQGEYDIAVEHAQKALEADAKLPNAPKGGSPDYIERLNDLKAAKDYILGFKKQ